jgi:hypothetical protein
MPNPLAVLMQLNAITLDLDEIQALINYGRNNAQTDQVAQLELDREQAEVDTRRAGVELAKLFHSSMN